MSEFLGRQDCIDSLRRDLVDLQGATLDVFSRTGPVRFSSWKFPDKLSCSLDMVALLEQYDFVDGEDAFNQHSHIVLLELVIDRLLLLLQSFNAYVEQISCSHGREQSRQTGCLSVGLVVRNYWSNLVTFASTKVINKDSKKQTKAFDCDETESVSSVSSHQMSPRGDFCRRCLSAPTSTRSSNKCLPSSSPTNNIPQHPKVHSHSVSCQTIQSSLVPCDACHQVQSTLRKTGDALVELFQSEGLPSSLQPLLVAVEDTLDLGHMTAGDVAQWANEQLRDMRRLAKHLEDVRGTVQPLRDRLAVAETERERFRSQLERAQKEFKQEREKHQANSVQLEFSLRKAQRSLKETEQRLQEEQQQFKRETLSLEESNSRLNEKVAQQEDTLQAVECEKNVLQEKLATLHMEEEACCKLQQKIQQLEDKISETQLHLDKENAKYHSACRQQESMQAKQKSLLKRVDALDEECEELQRQLGEREEREMDLHKQLQQMSEEKERVQAQLAQQQELCSELQNDKQTLETHGGELKNNVAELKEYVRVLRERERLMVAFPELSPVAQAQPQSTGNVLLDMEQQFQANDIRIKVLEQENLTLHASLVKLRERVHNNASREASPQQTWSLSAPGTPTEKQPDHLTHMQNSVLQSSSAPRLGCNSGNKAGRRQSAGSEDRMSTATAAAAASPSALQLHFQTVQLNTTAARIHTKTRSGSVLAHCRSLNQRRK
ncbi:coiled-coil domain-containing protein 157 isoform X2 [Larimichthys crocea]|uniref:coiled-coil domain-containing protein 157 isoform X2 n=1 Tax=Larimichthys crocea TaxID=215358 RepID=UPI000F5FDAF8|nr:coiled-coil domain-containing protein 157 isoform X2 [Larimichthys crocea]